MTYNEYAQVLEAENPDTGELYHAGGLQRDQLRGGRRRHAAGRDLGRCGGRLADDPAYQRRRRLASSLRRWRAGRSAATTSRQCRDDRDSRPDRRSARAISSGMMNEVNKLIWPASGANGVGLIDQAAWDQTVETSLSTPRTSTGRRCSPGTAGRRSVHERDRDRGGVGPARRQGARPRSAAGYSTDRGDAERGRQLITPTAVSAANARRRGSGLAAGQLSRGGVCDGRCPPM